MSLFQMKVRCPKCHRKSAFNPDVGQVSCEHCGAVLIGAKIINGLDLRGLGHGNGKKEKEFKK